MYRSGALGALVVCCGCGAAPQVAKVSTEEARPVAPATAPRPLSPVGPPASLILVGRLSRPDRTVAAFGLGSVSELFGKDLGGIDDAVMPDAPIEMAMTMEREGREDPVPKFFVSVGLRSLRAGQAYLRAQGKDVIEEGGVSYLSRADNHHCVVAEALGTAPARIVCSEKREDLVALLPYATRGLPLQALEGSALALELRAPVFRKVFEPELTQLESFSEVLLPSSREDPSTELLRHVLSNVVGESKASLEDAGLFTIAADLVGDTTPMVNLKAAFRFDGNKAWTTGLIRNWGRHATTPPDFFWRLPSDARAASYTAEMNAADFRGLRQAAGDLAQVSLASNGASPALQTRMRRLTNETLTLSGALVWAEGRVPPVPHGKLSAVAASAREDIGWHVIGTERGSAPFRVYVDEVRELVNSPELLRLLDLEVKRLPAPKDTPVFAAAPPPGGMGDIVRRMQERSKAALGKFGEETHSSPPDRAPPPPSIAQTVTTHKPPRGARLPQGAITFEVHVPDSWLANPSYDSPAERARKRGAPLVIALVLVPDDSPTGSRTWLGVSADEGLITAKLAAALSGGAKTLEARKDIDALKRQPAIVAGFAPWDEKAASTDCIPYVVTSNEDGGSATLSVSAELPLRALVENLDDITHLF